MPKKQKRFTSEAALLKEIDAVETRRIIALQVAEEREEHLKIQVPGAYKDFLRKEAGTARRRAERLENKKAELGKALSAFRTMLLPLGETDNSVVL